VTRQDNALPKFIRDGTAFTAVFTVPDREDILYSAEWSPSLLPGSWTAVPDTGEGTGHRIRVPGSAEKVFVRYKVEKR